MSHVFLVPQDRVFDNQPAKSRGISPDIKSVGIFRKIGQDDCIVIQAIDNKEEFYCGIAGTIFIVTFFSPAHIYL